MTTSCYVYWVPVNTMRCLSFVYTVYQHTIAITSVRVIHKRIYKLSTPHLLAAEDCLLSMPGDWSATLFEYLRLFLLFTSYLNPSTHFSNACLTSSLLYYWVEQH